MKDSKRWTVFWQDPDSIRPPIVSSHFSRQIFYVSAKSPRPCVSTTCEHDHTRESRHHVIGCNAAPSQLHY